jgi:hypothetical protein
MDTDRGLGEVEDRGVRDDLHVLRYPGHCACAWSVLAGRSEPGDCPSRSRSRSSSSRPRGPRARDRRSRPRPPGCVARSLRGCPRRSRPSHWSTSSPRRLRPKPNQRSPAVVSHSRRRRASRGIDDASQRRKREVGPDRGSRITATSTDDLVHDFCDGRPRTIAHTTVTSPRARWHVRSAVVLHS